MTKLITRVFPSVAEAEKAVDRLNVKFLPRRDRRIITDGPNAENEMRRANVHDSAIAPYSKHLASGAAVLVVQAGYKPLGAPKMVREVLAKYNTADMPDVVEEHKLPWTPDHAPSVLKDHPLFLTNKGVESPGRMSDGLSLPLLKAHKTNRPLMSGEKRMSRMFWPMPLLKTDRQASSAISGGRYMSRAFWPMSLLSTKPRRKSVIPGGDLPFFTPVRSENHDLRSAN